MLNSQNEWWALFLTGCSCQYCGPFLRLACFCGDRGNPPPKTLSEVGLFLPPGNQYEDLGHHINSASWSYNTGWLWGVVHLHCLCQPRSCVRQHCYLINLTNIALHSNDLSLGQGLEAVTRKANCYIAGS